tara:strand:- start:13972 stop:14157 length:186 start_codon:yes stop_codon:yes gene_type:complete
MNNLPHLCYKITNIGTQKNLTNLLLTSKKLSKKYQGRRKVRKTEKTSGNKINDVANPCEDY